MSRGRRFFSTRYRIHFEIMKVIGLIGGMSWESTAPYYRIINQEIRRRLGGLHSARCVLWSFDFAEIEELQHGGNWERLTERMIEAGSALEKAGADFLVICTNTMHITAEKLQAAVAAPLLHIADATADAIRAAGLKKVGLLGTRFTMERDFYAGRLRDHCGIETVIPDETDRRIVHDVIYRELCVGRATAASRDQYRTIIQRLVDEGAQGIVLGCTEIGLLVKAEDCPAPLFDTATIHAEAAAAHALD